MKTERITLKNGAAMTCVLCVILHCNNNIYISVLEGFLSDPANEIPDKLRHFISLGLNCRV